MNSKFYLRILPRGGKGRWCEKMNGIVKEPGLQKGKKFNWAQLDLTWGCCAWELDLSFFCSNLKDLGMR